MSAVATVIMFCSSGILLVLTLTIKKRKEKIVCLHFSPVP